MGGFGLVWLGWVFKGRLLMRIITNLDNKTWKNQETLKDIQQQIQSQHAQNTEECQNLRQEVLNDKRYSVNFWMGVLFFTFSTVSTLVYLEVKELRQEAETSVRKIKEIEQKAESLLEETRNHEKDAKDSFKAIQNIPAQLLNTEQKIIKEEKQKITKEAEQKVEKHGTKLQKLMLEALKQKDYKKAIALWQDIVTIANYKNDKKSLAFGYFNFGYSYGKLEKYQKAIDAYKEAIEIKPDFHEAYNSMGVAYGKLKKYQKAIDAFKKAIEIKPDFHEAYYNTGYAYVKLNKYQKAIDAYKRTIEIKPDFHEAYSSMGAAYGKLKKYQKAIDAFKKAIEIKPGFHEAYRGIGFSYLKLKKYQKAIDAFKKATEINPDDDEVKHLLQRALRDLKGQ